MFNKIKEFFTGKPATQLEVEVKVEAPYKVDPIPVSYTHLTLPTKP
jgi:hypothetical protein